MKPLSPGLLWGIGCSEWGWMGVSGEGSFAGRLFITTSPPPFPCPQPLILLFIVSTRPNASEVRSGEKEATRMKYEVQRENVHTCARAGFRLPHPFVRAAQHPLDNPTTTTLSVTHTPLLPPLPPSFPPSCSSSLPFHLLLPPPQLRTRVPSKRLFLTVLDSEHSGGRRRPRRRPVAAMSGAVVRTGQEGEDVHHGGAQGRVVEPRHVAPDAVEVGGRHDVDVVVRLHCEPLERVQERPRTTTQRCQRRRRS